MIPTLKNSWLPSPSLEENLAALSTGIQKWGSWLSQTASRACYRNSQTASDQREIARLIQKISLCPAAKRIWDRVNAAGPVEIYLIDPEKMAQRAVWNHDLRVIKIQRDHLELDSLSYLLFELSNGLRSNAFKKIHEKGEAGEISQTDFAKEKMRLEYASAELYHRTIGSCVKSSFWDPDMDHSRKYFEGENAPWKTVDRMWQHYQTDPDMASHRAHHRHHWQSKMKAPFCREHPSHADCK